MECIFGPYLKGCSSSKSRIIKISSTRLETVKKKSIKRKDNFNKKLKGLSSLRRMIYAATRIAYQLIHQNSTSTATYLMKVLQMTLHQRNAPVDRQPHSFNGRRIASFVAKFVLWKRTTDIGTDGERHISAGQRIGRRLEERITRKFFSKFVRRGTINGEMRCVPD